MAEEFDLKLIGLILLFLCGVFVGYQSHAADYVFDVDWPSSNSKESILAVTINGCESRFTVRNSKIDDLTNSKRDLEKIVKIAFERAKNGCK